MSSARGVDLPDAPADPTDQAGAALGPDALAAISEMEIPLARADGLDKDRLGEVQRLTPMIDALYVPNIDESLDEDGAKREFWGAFRLLGQWWADLPPY